MKAYFLGCSSRCLGYLQTLSDVSNIWQFERFWQFKQFKEIIGSSVTLYEFFGKRLYP